MTKVALFRAGGKMGVRLPLSRGVSVASVAIKSNESNTTCVAPSRYALFKAYLTTPDLSIPVASADNAGREIYRRGRPGKTFQLCALTHVHRYTGRKAAPM
ncbi:MAG: hypothetical protein AB8B87_10415 [Granulosicoccus sp.]